MTKFSPSLILILFICHAHSASREALPGWTYRFPEDHGSHAGFKTEWWYFTGNVRSTDGTEFGYQLTFFRQGVIDSDHKVPESRFIQRDVKFAHFAISEITSKKFHHFQKLARGAFGEAGFDEENRIAWIEDWSCERTDTHAFRLRAADKDIVLDLDLKSSREPVIHGRNGVSQKSAGEGRASHYYSLTRMNTKGELSINGKKYNISGETWFDHEWATNQLAENQTGWDWFSLQFDDGSDLMLFQIRTKAGGRDPYSSGTFVTSTGETIKIDLDDFQLEPTEWWTSPKSKGRYPVAWKLSIPKLAVDCILRARFNNQELAAEPFSYWEGAVSAEGRHEGQPLKGKGYLEMTGYAGAIVGMQAK